MDPLSKKQNYTWAEFVATITGLLDADGKRVGVGSMALGQIRQATIEVQSLIPAYRVRHETVYYPCDFVSEVHASKARKPPQSVIEDIWICRPMNPTPSLCIAPGSDLPPTFDCSFWLRNATEPYEWDDRFELVNGRANVNTGRGKVAIDPAGSTFYIYPEVFDGYLISVFWNGIKVSFNDIEETPFDEQMAGCVALYVKAYFARTVQKDINLYNSFITDYRKARTLLYSTARERAFMR